MKFIRTALRRRRIYKSLPTLFKRHIKYLNPGDVCIDLGANRGDIVGLMAKSGALIHAFEPNPVAFKRLQLLSHTYQNVKVYNSAGGIKNGVVQLNLHQQTNQFEEDLTQAGTLMDGKPNTINGPKISVEAINFAEFLNKFDRVKLLKIDIEGYEVELIPHLLENDCFHKVDVAFIELHDKKWPALKHQTATMVELINNSGFSNRIKLDWI